jgi:NAD(P)-dependent dehydrogenase (short-subunit alcohol dehydrogenase family)
MTGARKDQKMTQRTWLITGVNSGFGRHMTEQLLARGDRVAGTVRKMDAMNGSAYLRAQPDGGPIP